MIISIIFGLSGILWLGFMLVYPTKWDNFVEKENGYWVKKGWISESTGQKIAGFEKGIVLKILLIIATAVSLANVWILNSL